MTKEQRELKAKLDAMEPEDVMRMGYIPHDFPVRLKDQVEVLPEVAVAAKWWRQQLSGECKQDNGDAFQSAFASMVARVPRGLVGLKCLGYSVGSWCPTPDGTGPATAVAIEFEIVGCPPLIVRLKSPAAVDEFIAALRRHQADVWPEVVS